jgi:hypothetical protein
MPDTLAPPVRDGHVTAPAGAAPIAAPALPASQPPLVCGVEALAEAKRLAKIERRLLAVIQWVIYGGVILLTLGAGALSWSHLVNIAATNGHIAPAPLQFLFPAIIDGFMALSSGVIVRHALTDELGWRTWYAGLLVAATAVLSICLNIQDSTGAVVVAAWALPGIAPALFMLGTELGLAELRLAMRGLRARVRAAQPPPPTEPPPPSKKEVVLAVLRELDWHVPRTLTALDERGVQVDRSYVYEIKREERAQTATV